jgi:hypothetical protein
LRRAGEPLSELASAGADQKKLPLRVVSLSNKEMGISDNHNARNTVSLEDADGESTANKSKK